MNCFEKVVTCPECGYTQTVDVDDDTYCCENCGAIFDDYEQY